MLNILMEEPIFERAAQKYLTPAALRHVQRMAETSKKTVHSHSVSLPSPSS